MRIGRRTLGVVIAGVVVIVHAGIQRSARRVLVVETKRVAYFLADNMLFLGPIVICRQIEIAVVNLHRALEDVVIGVDPNFLKPADPARKNKMDGSQGSMVYPLLPAATFLAAMLAASRQ